MAPPDVPVRGNYKPLGQLLEAVKRGARFCPVTVADIRAAASPAKPAGPEGAPAAACTAFVGTAMMPCGHYERDSSGMYAECCMSGLHVLGNGTCPA